MSEFDRATAVTLLDRATALDSLDRATADRATADRATAVYSADLSAVWTIAGKPNGGYLLAILANAAVDSLTAAGREHRAPLSASASYVRAPAPGPALVTTEVVRIGRSASQVRATLVQDDQVQVDASFVLGQIDPSAPIRWNDRPPVALPPREACTRVHPDGSGFPLAIMEVVDLRLDPAVTGFTQRRPGGTAELRGWLHFADGRPPDPLALLYFADALPPPPWRSGHWDGCLPCSSPST